MRPFALVACVVAALSAGCASTVVRPNPGPNDKGFRFYRGKPYLFIQPVVYNPDHNAPSFVSITWDWLPDFSEQYSVRARAGLGVNKTKVTFEEGWNLTKIDYDIDSKTDENIKAVGGLIKSVSGKFGASSKADTGKRVVRAILPAHNVPLGYYEAVINCDETGVKRFYGWRYLGFIPFASCPVDGEGKECVDCHNGELYGLVHENGLTAFKRLDLIASEPINKLVPQPTTTRSQPNKELRDAVAAVRAMLVEKAQVAVGPNNFLRLDSDYLDARTVSFTVVVKQDIANGDAVATLLKTAFQAVFTDNPVTSSVIVESVRLAK